jgi:hypothetical protein
LKRALRRLAGLGALCLSALAVGSAALAEGVARVVLVGPSPDDAIVVRLRREIELLGMEVETVSLPEGMPDLAGLARAHHAAAVVAVERSPSAVVLWTAPARDPAAPREVRLDEGPSGAGQPRLLVLRAVEILRERLLAPPPPGRDDAGAAGSPPPAALPVAPPPLPTAAPEAPPAPTGARGPSVFLGPALLASPGGVGVTPHVWLGARWAPLDRLDLELVALLPTTATTVTASEGSMSLRAGALGAGVAARLTAPAARLFVTAGAGLGAMLVAFDGAARAPWTAASGLRAVLLPHARAAAGYWIAPWFALRADVLLGFALPEPALWIAGQRVATFAEPATLLAVGLEVRP